MGAADLNLSHDVASGSDITPRKKIDKPLVVYILAHKIMTSIITLRENGKNPDVFHAKNVIYFSKFNVI